MTVRRLGKLAEKSGTHKEFLSQVILVLHLCLTFFAALLLQHPFFMLKLNTSVTILYSQGEILFLRNTEILTWLHSTDLIMQIFFFFFFPCCFSSLLSLGNEEKLQDV